jgi:AraC-like DNA-binding protein
MDALSEILQSVKLEGAVFFNAEFTEPWGVRSPASCEVAKFLRKSARHLIIFHFLTDGHARAEMDAHGVELTGGDIVVLPHGDAHLLSNGCPTSLVDNGRQLKDVFAQGMTPMRYGGGGEATRFVCGFMECDPELSKTFLSGLPPVFKVNIRRDPTGQWLENAIKFSAAEAAKHGAGSDAVLARLAEALFVETMRRYMGELPPQQTGWLAGARDPGVGSALAHLHRTPERPWTIADLARQVGVSRSVLARKCCGRPATAWRESRATWATNRSRPSIARSRGATALRRRATAHARSPRGERRPREIRGVGVWCGREYDGGEFPRRRE